MMRYAGPRPADRCPSCGGRLVPGQPERHRDRDEATVVRQPGKCERCGQVAERFARLRFGEWRKAG